MALRASQAAALHERLSPKRRPGRAAAYQACSWQRASGRVPAHLCSQVLRLLPRGVGGIRLLCSGAQGQRAVRAAAAQRGRPPGLPHRLAQLPGLGQASCSRQGTGGGRAPTQASLLPFFADWPGLPPPPAKCWQGWLSHPACRPSHNNMARPRPARTRAQQSEEARRQPLIVLGVVGLQRLALPSGRIRVQLRNQRHCGGARGFLHARDELASSGARARKRDPCPALQACTQPGSAHTAHPGSKRPPDGC